MATTKKMESGFGTDNASRKMKICHPSVCVGGSQPSSCVCPTTAKK